ncbi:MAG: LysE family translocator [Hyphomicrobiales bacterium]|nr:LysE family translocator [Hyphomicrobiales bacterium]
MDYLPDATVLTAFTAGAIVLALAPGADMVFFLGRTLAGGRRLGIVALAGAGAGLFVHSVLAAVGLAALLAASVTLFNLVKIAGALYLLWLAFMTIRHGAAARIDPAGDRGTSLRRTFLEGLGINILNPKIVAFFVTFLPQFVDAGDPHAGGKLFVLGVYFIIVATPICLALILTADRFTAALRRSPRLSRGIDWLFAGVMASFAVRLLFARSN